MMCGNKALEVETSEPQQKFFSLNYKGDDPWWAEVAECLKELVNNDPVERAKRGL